MLRTILVRGVVVAFIRVGTFMMGYKDRLRLIS